MLTKNTTELRLTVEQHIAADSVIQGTYWNPEKHKGCFIGCLAHSNDPSINEEKYGLPLMLQRIAESIFEALPAEDARAFFAALPDAVACDGKDLTKVGWQFLSSELRSLPPQPAEIEAVLNPVIAGMDLLAEGNEWPEAASAANAANAADDAAWAAITASKAASAAMAARAANATSKAAWIARAAMAARAANAAASAATWAAGTAGTGARMRQRDLLLRLIAEAPVVPQQQEVK
jgi:hypothetical protein